MMKIKKYQASALIVSLLVLAAILIISLSVSFVSLKERKISSGSNKSSQAFQIADSGAELALEKIKKENWTTIKKFEDNGMNCNNGVVTGNISDGSYELTFKDSTGKSIGCGDDSSIIADIKSVGKYKETNRAIEVAVASGGGSLTCWTTTTAFAGLGSRCSQECATGSGQCVSAWGGSNVVDCDRLMNHIKCRCCKINN